MSTPSPTEQLEQQTVAYGLISWSGVLLGALIALAITLALNVLGGAVGASFIDPAQRTTPGATTAIIFTGVWLLLATVIGSFVGGYIGTSASGFSRGKSVLHGLAVWGIVTLVTAMLAGSALMSGASGVASAAGNAIGGVSSAAATGAASVDAGPVNTAVTRVRNTLGIPANVSEGVVSEITDIARRRLTADSLSQADRDRLTQLITQNSNISPQDAAARIDQAEVQAAQAAQSVRETAETTAESAAAVAFWAFTTMLLSLVAAVIGAGYGDRDETMPDLFGFRTLIYSGGTQTRSSGSRVADDDTYVPPYKNRNNPNRRS